MGEHTHGARAKGSNRSEDDDIHPVSEQYRSGRRAGVKANRGNVVRLIAGERNVAFSNGSDDPALGEFFEAINREHHVQVKRDARPIKVLAPMPERSRPRRLSIQPS